MGNRAPQVSILADALGNLIDVLTTDPGGSARGLVVRAVGLVPGVLEAIRDRLPPALFNGRLGVDLLPSIKSTANSTTTKPTVATPFTGTADQLTATTSTGKSYASVTIALATAVSSGLATGTVFFEFSPDGTTWDVSVPVPWRSDSPFIPIALRAVLPFFRVRAIVADASSETNLSAFRLTSTLHASVSEDLTRLYNQAIDARTEPVKVVRSGIMGTEFNNRNILTNAQLAEHTVDDAQTIVAPLTNGTGKVFTADASTDVFTSAAHGYSNGDAVNLTTTGVLPAPLTTSTTSAGVTSETVYYVRDVTTNTFKLAIDPEGAAVNITDAGTGVHTVTKRGQFVGPWVDIRQAGHLFPFFLSTVKPAVFQLEWSKEGLVQTTDLIKSTAITVETLMVAGVGTFYVAAFPNNVMVDEWYRLRVVNGPTDQIAGLNDFRVFVGRESYQGSFGGLNAPLTALSTALLTRAVQAGVDPDGNFKNARIQGRHTANSTTDELAGSGVFRGTWFPWQESFGKLVVDASADVPGTLYVDFSQADNPANGVDTDITGDPITIPFDPAVVSFVRRQVVVQSKWVRTRWVNGPAAQAFFALDSSFLVGDPGLGLKTATDLITKDVLLGMVDSVLTAFRHEVQTATVHLRTTRNTAGKDGLHAHITGFEDDVHLQPLSAAQARQFTVGASAIQVDLPLLNTPGKRRAVEIQTYGRSWGAYGFSSGITFDSNSIRIPPNSWRRFLLDAGVPLWFITQQTGGTQTVQNVNGVSATGTATSPSNALTSDDTRASIGANGQTIRIVGGNYTPTASSSIQSVRIGCEARKQSGQFETGTFAEVQTGNAASVGSVTSGSISGGSLMTYLVAISREVTSGTNGTVSGVSGLGLTWTQVLSQNSDDNNRRLDVWVAKGTATAGTVMATFATNPSSSHIAVHRYTGIDQTTPVQASGGTVANSATVTGPALAGTNKGISFLAVAIDNTTSTPGTGYTERSDEKSASGTIDGLTTETKALTATATETASATLAAAKHYAAIGVTLSPSTAIDPIVTLSYETPSGTAGTTTGNLTFSSTSDGSQFVDISGDKAPWVESNIDNIVLIATGQTIGAAALEVDRVWVEVTDTTGNTVRVSCGQYAGDSTS